MEKRKFTSLNADVSLLGFGLMRLPILDGDRSKIDYPKAQAMVDAAIKAGVNYFDTGHPYHNGASEVFAGETLTKYPRDSYYLATKMPIWMAKSKEEMEKIFEDQLQKCKTPYFDFYLVHAIGADRMATIREFGLYEYLSKKKEQGIIKRLGFSFHDNAEVVKKVIGEYKWDFAQIQLNYLDWETSDAKRLYEILTENKIPVIIMEPVKGGTLAKLNEKTIEVLKKADPASSAASWALRYTASLPNVMTVLSGMTEPEQVEDNIKTFKNFKPFTEQDYKVIEETLSVYRKTASIPCTNCRYCMDCPSGVEIPDVFAMYSHYLFTKNRMGFENQYKTLKDSGKANNCTSCGKCVDLCPQKIDIPKYMKEITDFTVPKKPA